MPTVDIPDKICPHCGGTRWYTFIQDGKLKKTCYKRKQDYLLQFYKDNPGKHLSYRRKSFKEKSKKLTTSYIKELIVQFTDLSFDDIPQELVELKRKQLLLKRQIKNNGKN
jgi:hypothetical protein